MRDTTAEFMERCRSLMGALTPQRRLEMTFELYEFGRELVRAGIRHRNPQATEREVARELVLRFSAPGLPASLTELGLASIDRRFAHAATAVSA